MSLHQPVDVHTFPLVFVLSLVYDKFGVRVVGYLKKDVVVNSGKGTIDNPYKIK